MPDRTARTSCDLSKLTAAKYLFRLQAETRIQLPPYKGSALHGGFGHALKKISPFYYQQLCEPGRNNAHPKPFVLLPPLDNETVYPPGQPFTCELTLFGNAVLHFPICHAALEYLGREMGFGNNRGKFSVKGIETALPESCDQPIQSGRGISGQVIAASCVTAANNRITVHFPTRLRLKADGHLIRTAPPFHLFFARLLGRLNTLSSFYGTGKIAEHELRNKLLQQAWDINIVKDNARWQDLPRFSGRQQSWMKFGGLLGSITYEGNLQPFLPCLAVGEWTHLGGKTSFGLGKIAMDRQRKI